MMVGYRYMDFGRDHPAHALTLTPSLSADLWLAKHLALEGSLAVGASVTLSDPSSGVGAPVLPDVMLRLGLAF